MTGVSRGPGKPRDQPCQLPCSIFGRGHVTNPIQARLAGERPWGWRDGSVSAVDGLTVSVEYIDGGGIRVWHHRPAGVVIGDAVRVHEGCVLLERAGRWLSVNIVGGGRGAVPEPEHPDLWTPEMRGTVVDLQDGTGFPV